MFYRILNFFRSIFQNSKGVENEFHKIFKDRFSCANIFEVEKKLQSGISIGEKDSEGNTILHLAAKNFPRQWVEMLLRNGANPDAQNAQGRTPLHFAASTLATGIMGGVDVSGLVAILDKKAFVDSRDNAGVTPLMIAYSVPIAQELIKRGANVNSKDKNGRTILHFISQHQSMSGSDRIEMLKILLEKKVELKGKDKDGKTAKDLAMAEKNNYAAEVFAKELANNNG